MGLVGAPVANQARMALLIPAEAAVRNVFGAEVLEGAQAGNVFGNLVGFPQNEDFDEAAGVTKNRITHGSLQLSLTNAAHRRTARARWSESRIRGSWRLDIAFAGEPRRHREHYAHTDKFFMAFSLCALVTLRFSLPRRTSRAAGASLDAGAAFLPGAACALLPAREKGGAARGRRHDAGRCGRRPVVPARPRQRS